jgi:pimeloyl-ACP methyl ester carboxylesterase
MAATATTSDGVRIAYDEGGLGEPALVCLHGWCSDGFQFLPIVERLSRTRRTVVLEWRGHGQSERPARDYGYSELAQDALAVIEAANVQQVVPVASSHAGWAAIDLRRRLNGRIAGLVLINWMVLGAPPPFLAGLRRLQQPDGWADVRDELFLMWRGDGDAPRVKEQLARMAQYGADSWMRAGREIEGAFRHYGAPLEVLSAFDPPVPTMHIYAQPADPAPFEAQRRFASLHPWFSVHRVEAQSHFPQLERPDQIAGLIEEFVSELRSSGSHLA